MIKRKGHLGARARVASVDWLALRRAYVERPERPLHDQLSAEFGVGVERIVRAASDEGWAMLRAKHLDAQLAQCDAGLALLKAAKVDTLVLDRVTNTALEILRKIDETVGSLDGKKAASTRMSLLNTASFALSNVANSLHRVGVVGLPKGLKDAAGEANGRWNPQMLSALNVTVQNIVGAQAGLQQSTKVTVPEASSAPTAANPGPLAVDGVSAPPPTLAEPSGAALDLVPDEERDLVAESVL